MDQKHVLKFIQDQGYKSLVEIRDQFKNENQEILDAILVALQDHGQIRKAPYQSPNGASYLFYAVARE